MMKTFKDNLDEKKKYELLFMAAQDALRHLSIDYEGMGDSLIRQETKRIIENLERALQ